MITINKFNKISTDETWNAENIYHLKTDLTRISKLIYHYEIYKKIIDIPGDVIECGVFKGISLVRFLTFRHILESENSRKIYGFDVFGKFPKPTNSPDKKFLKRWESLAGDGISLNELKEIIEKKKIHNFKLIQGDVIKTIPTFIQKNKRIKISLLHLDMDIYKPTKFILEKLVNKIVKGGIILIDDYNSVYGATKAVDEFLKKNRNLKIKKLTNYKTPFYIVID
jgi:hypothetical protein|tara:strand:+ start:102 stop:776 length:675 start_codon:yes stop_codon:yes gene_type:complete